MPLGLPSTPAMAQSCLDLSLPPAVLQQIRQLRHFVAESAKTARAFLKRMDMPVALCEIAIQELNENTPVSRIASLLAPLCAGADMGMVSEAGCPAVADPGSALVALAHERGIRVVPMVGPSSLLLALMASGLEGQRFAFHGYLPVKPGARATAIRALEKESAARGQTQLFIETPYRGAALLADILRVAAPDTRLSLARDLTLPAEFIKTLTIRAWRAQPLPDLRDHPAIFLLLGKL
jgi:16S rRNA (cytidine1402-2'-O)-methyltransferase